MAEARRANRAASGHRLRRRAAPDGEQRRHPHDRHADVERPGAAERDHRRADHSGAAERRARRNRRRRRGVYRRHAVSADADQTDDRHGHQLARQAGDVRQLAQLPGRRRPGLPSGNGRPAV